MIAVTGATGHLGQLVIQNLLMRGVSPSEITAIVRSRVKAAELLPGGLQVREADYTDAAALEKAFAGVERLLLISGNEVGQRLPQHTNIVNAAKKAGVQFLAYTSILKADTSKMQLASEHLATEKLIRASGIPFTFLRNGWYIENYLDQLGSFTQHGAVLGAAQNGKVSAATRADLAEAAAVVLSSANPQNVYELGGAAFSLEQLAAAVTKSSGVKVVYKDLPEKEYAGVLVGVGLPAEFAAVLADSDVGIVRGDLFTQSGDLAKLLGREPISLDEALAARKH